MSVSLENRENTGWKFDCPHCGGGIVVADSDVRCTIFRHGAFKNNGEPIPPHTPQSVSETWVAQGLIYGCGKPFKFDRKTLIVCDWI
jgi:hypothetical protein